MLVFLKCVAEAVAAKGVQGLVQWVPGGPYLYDVAADAGKRLRERRKREQIHDELRVAAAASFEEAKAAAEQVAREVAADGPVEDRVALELYLSQVPGAVRKSLRRAEDHTGRSVPAGLVLDTPDDLIRVLPPQMPQFRPGQPLPGRPGWALLEPLGAGGFGEVWRVGHDLVPDGRAVKFCTDPAARQRLLSHEGKLIARVMRECRGPNVVGLVDADLAGDPPWLAYEFVGGGDLTGLILSWQGLPADERVGRAAEAVRVLSEAAGRFHALTPPIVHRDLKPANILVAADGSLKVTDFGIGGIAAARGLSGSRDGLTAYTRAVSALSGAYTPLYAGPQQQRGEPPDPRDDVHALGVIAYQMLTGRLDAAPGPRFDRHLRDLGVPEPVVALVGDCVDPEAANRPRDGRDLADRLRPPAAPPAPPAPPEPPRPAPAPRAASPARDPAGPGPDVPPPPGAARPVRTAVLAGTPFLFLLPIGWFGLAEEFRYSSASATALLAGAVLAVAAVSATYVQLLVVYRPGRTGVGELLRSYLAGVGFGGAVLTAILSMSTENHVAAALVAVGAAAGLFSLFLIADWGRDWPLAVGPAVSALVFVRLYQLAAGARLARLGPHQPYRDMEPTALAGGLVAAAAAFAAVYYRLTAGARRDRGGPVTPAGTGR